MKKGLLPLLSLVLVLVLVPNFVIGEGLKDIEASPYKIEIEKLVTEGIILGYPDGTFMPEATITRAELSSIFVRSLKLEPDSDAANHFIDVKGKWHQGIIGGVYKSGLMIGKSKLEFVPEENVTMEELAVILIRGFDLEKSANELKIKAEFTDNDKIATWSKNSVALAYDIELINGTLNDDGTITFNPKKHVDRQTVAKLVYELIYNKDIYNKRLNDLIKLDEDSEKSEVVDEKPTYESIVSKYNSKMNSLQLKYVGLLDSLLEQAKIEYNNEKDNPDFSITSMYFKYESIALDYETQADREVDDILSLLEGELNQFGYDASIASEMLKQYNEIKESTESDFDF